MLRFTGSAALTLVALGRSFRWSVVGIGNHRSAQFVEHDTSVGHDTAPVRCYRSPSVNVPALLSRVVIVEIDTRTRRFVREVG